MEDPFSLEEVEDYPHLPPRGQKRVFEEVNMDPVKNLSYFYNLQNLNLFK